MKTFVVTKEMWLKQRPKEDLPLVWFYYYFMLKRPATKPFISLSTFSRAFSIYIHNLIMEKALTQPDVNVYEVLVHTIYNYFDYNLTDDNTKT